MVRETAKTKRAGSCEKTSRPHFAAWLLRSCPAFHFASLPWSAGASPPAAFAFLRSAAAEVLLLAALDVAVSAPFAAAPFLSGETARSFFFGEASTLFSASSKVASRNPRIGFGA